MIAFQQVQVRYRGGTQALQDVSLDIQPGEAVAILGTSGAGKSTLLKLLTRELTPSGGTVTVDGVDLKHLSGRVLRLYREKLGIVWQDLRLIAHLTVVENVALPLELRGIDPKEISLRLEPVLQRLNLLPWARSFPHTLSAGRQRLAGIARALISEPAVVIADEPTADLDPVQQQLILSLFQEMRSHGTTIIVATHSPEVASALGGRIVRLADGHVVSGTGAVAAAIKPATPPPSAPPRVAITAS